MGWQKCLIGGKDLKRRRKGKQEQAKINEEKRKARGAAEERSERSERRQRSKQQMRTLETSLLGIPQCGQDHFDLSTSKMYPSIMIVHHLTIVQPRFKTLGVIRVLLIRTGQNCMVVDVSYNVRASGSYKVGTYQVDMDQGKCESQSFIKLPLYSLD